MQQLDALQQAVQNLQKTVDTQAAVLKTLVEQSSDNVNKIKSNMDELRDSTQKNLAASNAHLDSMTTQIQALSESLDEAKSRTRETRRAIGADSEHYSDFECPQPTCGCSAGRLRSRARRRCETPGQRPRSGQSLQFRLELLQRGAVRPRYSGFSGLSQSLQWHGQGVRTAQFYVGDSYYNQKNYKNAVAEFDKCLERYPQGDKAAAARLKKGFALIELGEKNAAVRELRSLIDQYPNSREADLARQRLKKLGVPVSLAHRRTG